MVAATAAVLAAPAAVPPQAPAVRCALDDRRLAELSGLVVDGDLTWAVADGGSRAQLYKLDADCNVVETRSAGIDPFDVEDLARGPDGALWAGDVGDNDLARSTVAVIVLPAAGDARLHRLTYPDGPHDAEALLVDADGRPIVITKEVGKPAGVYRTALPPDGTGPTPLLRVGEVTLPASETVGGPIGGAGSRVVTGAAVTADGRVVALRSYTDAWLYPVSGGDLVGALAGAPVQVPLPDEPQGEAIAFQRDGTLISGSETRGGVPGRIRTVAGAVALVPVGDRVGGAPAPGGGPLPALSLPVVLAGSALAAVLVALAAVFAVRVRSRS